MLDQVVGDSPRSTLLNFYAVMAEVGQRADRLGQAPGADRDGGLARQEQIDDTELLFNLFAGLSIQTDRPLRVGEFCEVGGTLGFVTKIGLRSMELQTLESRVTIPNSVADEATIINFSRRGLSRDRPPTQGLEVRLPIRDPLSPYQLEELLRQARKLLQR
ncbi:mechanosensitive ion channel family protein [Synechococcus sp. MEDNS5]|uniref:mechanosensitive ion channel family protein n=1 Tax=Synechococcus sp. MEDNS5 TaxID=1442554 RepID=UPI002103EAD3|nr:mechanosensitive ion channel domain-containing protein [Synechococcus sp. MEDNS5]